MGKLDVRREAFARQGTQLKVLGRTLRIAGSPGKAVYEIGAEGLVHLATDDRTGDQFRIKCFWEPDDQRRIRSEKLIALGPASWHPEPGQNSKPLADPLGGAPFKVLSNLGRYTPFALIMKNVPGTTWRNLKEFAMHDSGYPPSGWPSKRVRLTWAYRLATAVKKMESHGFIHGHLSPGNVVVIPAALRSSSQTGWDEGDIGLVDFDGFFYPSYHLTPTSVFRGDAGYSAPEIWLGEPVTIGADRVPMAILIQEFLIAGDPRIEKDEAFAWSYDEDAEVASRSALAHPFFAKKYPAFARLVAETLRAPDSESRPLPDQWTRLLREALEQEEATGAAVQTKGRINRIDKNEQGDQQDVFISYRHEGGHAEARAIRSALRERGVQAFLDVADVRRGYFDEALLRQIAHTPNFVVILSPNSLDRCEGEKDWLRREIAHAIQTRKNIIPVLLPGFTFPLELPSDIASLSRYQGQEYSHRYFDAMLTEIIENLERKSMGTRKSKTDSQQGLFVGEQTDVDGGAKGIETQLGVAPGRRLTLKTASGLTPQIVTLLVDDGSRKLRDVASTVTEMVQDLIITLQSESQGSAYFRYLINLCRFGGSIVELALAATPLEIDIERASFTGDLEDTGKEGIYLGLRWAAQGVRVALDRCRQTPGYREQDAPPPVCVLLTGYTDVDNTLVAPARELRSIPFRGGSVCLACVAVGAASTSLKSMRLIASPASLVFRAEDVALAEMDFIAHVASTVF